MSTVKITAHPETGKVVQETSNPEVAFVRVESEQQEFVNGWFRNSKRSALIMGKPDELKNFKAGQSLRGKIVIEESTKQAYASQSPKINPESGEVLEKDGQPIYRNTRFTTNLEEQDTMIQHDTEESLEGVTSSQEDELSIQ